ncbi:PREDICTED: kielin/chordin-like protein [Nicrophorus vespilloides]|uniref:Kielin/chordin-like protein n=1 Tax=Nicrophorus vespilloides TaxID=110193 RepID=A0ABM1MCD3_NICVS|nr:PREDICTED: kielin/chordin-like protein [Nicrophorus vespilloides]
MNLRLTKLVLFCAAITIIHAQEICDHLGTLPYEEIGCTPTLGPDGCPKSFDCSHYEVPSDGCIFKGQTYQNREYINDTAPCNVACYCNRENSFGPDIACAAIDCNWNVYDDCYQVNDLDLCCPTGQKCPPFDDLATCQVDGKIYKEGQYFRPEGQCLRCVCQKGFIGEFVEPFCRRVQCDVELRFAKQIAEGCAPAYTRTADALCCPIDYICPSNTLSISALEDSTVSQEKCIYGQLEFNINDVLNLTYNKYNQQKVAECSCILPPHLTCRSDF